MVYSAVGADGMKFGVSNRMVNALIVGAGYAGSVMARELADAGCKVRLIDRRPHIAGNAYDEPDAYGVLVHRYGPHIFHTHADRKSVVQGRSVTERVDLGGRRHIQKTKKHIHRRSHKH